MDSNTARSCRDPAFSPPEAIKPRNPRLTEVEIEILVRLLGYGCTAANAAIYLDRPAELIERELKRLGL
ncbi:hypothetical protein GC207_02565 [bacterium]|nr:hypothetical protein [bacterium]